MIRPAMSATATRNGHSANPVGDGRLRPEDEESPETESRGSLPERLIRALASQAVSYTHLTLPTN